MKNKKALERISQMEEIFDRCSKTVSEFEERITEFEELQSDIQKLEAYYTGKDWKNDLKLDEAGDLPEDLKRGVLSEDGIYDLLEKNNELLSRIKAEE
ncbi:MAG: DUF4298 domain-containing protein [Saccharofermentans sp.]|jgi:hypothetical protein|nr:DUF4298 domain-containing protein [Clostridiales bacterium]MCR5384543.1 DUF4298 domain-containing protein [Saccharofermentans sp.]